MTRRVGRPHSPIDPQGPLAAFASGPLGLKIGSNLTYEQAGRKVSFRPSVLTEAAAGKRLPTLPVALAYVRASGGLDRGIPRWERRWQQARHHLRQLEAGGAHA
ncbi:hypothetical protein ACQP2P_36235 [Dactylosporangium sp. CA-139114]|uniref:hypothetical protein n=1 Tax=Dactylosporangium sp. CA-139114 TaxID=3239931 RepID=UPI003D95AC56